MADLKEVRVVTLPVKTGSNWRSKEQYGIS